MEGCEEKKVGLTSRMPSSIVREETRITVNPEMDQVSLVAWRASGGRNLLGMEILLFSHEIGLGHLFTTGIRKPLEGP